ncbi:MAG: DASS family sodium-coupled anion symporter [Chlamydiia bacterium]|nr:DASS family sodium-coupled anion symporter [Chlamydiia bacterium]
MEVHDGVRSPVHWWSLISCFILGAVLWFLPHPERLSPEAWKLSAIFLATILGIILKPMPLGLCALLSIVLASLLGVLPLSVSLNQFSNPLLWLVLFAFYIARGFVVTGLGARIAYWAVAFLGKRTLGMAYGLMLSDLVLAPAIPSLTARCGGVMFPIVQSLARAFDSLPHQPSRDRIGGYLTLCCYNVSITTSAMFVTAMAANPLIVGMAAELGVKLTWTSWALAASVPGLISLLLLPLTIYAVCPPGIKQTPDAPEIARQHLRELGPMRPQEWIMAGTFVALVTLWILGGMLGLSATVVAMMGVGFLVMTGVLRWEDLMRLPDAMDTFIWFSILMMLANSLSTYGVIDWFTREVMLSLGGLAWQGVLIALCLIYFYSHYFFASGTAQVGAMYVAFLGLSISVGAPPMLAALIFAAISNLFACLTHYGSSPAPLLYGAGYVSLRHWWTVGFAMSLQHLFVWGVIGVVWWKVLGYW